MRIGPIAFSTAIAAGLLVAGPAQASSIRYASPTGLGVACTQAAPCSLSQAVSFANDGDIVQLGADEYYLDVPLDVTVDNLTIRGPAGTFQPADFRAFIFFREQADGGIPDGDAKLRVFGNNARFERLSIVGRADGSASIVGAGTGTGASYDRVAIRNIGESDTLVGQGVTVTNSAIQQIGPGNLGSAVSAQGTFTNSLAYSATGTAILQSDAYIASPYCSTVIRNSIVWGGAANLKVDGGYSGCTAVHVDYDYSWIPDPGGPGLGGGIPMPVSGTVTAGPHNLPRSPAVFEPSDGFIGAYVLSPDSPAVNAGCSECSDHDFYGRPRPIGPAADIGPMEQSLPPAVATPTVSSVTDSAATVSSRVEPRGEQTTYALQYRRSRASEWNSTPDYRLTDDLFGATTVSVTLEPLAPGTSYEARYVASNSLGSVTGPVVTFRTEPVPTATVSVSGLKAKVTKKKAKLTSRVTVSQAGRIGQAATTGNATKRCTVSKRVAAAGTYKVVCPFRKKARKALRSQSMKLTVVTTFEPSSGGAVATTTTLKLKRKR